MDIFVIAKQVDSVGRIVIPKEIRKYYGFNEGDFVKIIPNENGILLASNKKD